MSRERRKLGQGQNLGAATLEGKGSQRNLGMMREWLKGDQRSVRASQPGKQKHGRKERSILSNVFALPYMSPIQKGVQPIFSIA